MKFLFDLLPVILFFGAYKIAGLYPEASLSLASSWLGDGIVATQAPILIATAVAMVAAAAQIALVWLRRRKVDGMLWVSFAIIVVFGGATLFFHNPTFIKWKPTALYWLFGAVLLVAGAVFKRNLIRKMLEAQLQLPDGIWDKLNLAWALFFISMGGLNLYVAYSFSEETWVNFKLFGMSGLLLVFALLQGLYLSRHLEEDAR